LLLTIGRSQSDLILSWPEAASAGYILEFSNILPGANWSNESTAPVVSAGQKSVTVPITQPARFYRLMRP
jgi:hypothetical protein